MRVYKATKNDMTCMMGRGIFQYELNVPAYADSAKCANRGLHACEYVLDCFRYYSLNDRIFMAEAEDGIDEDGTDTRVSCRKLTLIKELSRRDIVEHAIFYMVRHPEREWMIDRPNVTVQKEKAEGLGNGIVIVRGMKPKARGKKGDVLGFLMEYEPGWFANIGLCQIDGKYRKENVWYTITREGIVVEAKE